MPRIFRDDLSDKLIHFTKGTPKEAANSFLSIIKQQKLIGGTGFIKGKFKCVCFTESPISKFPTLFNDSAFKYAPLGVMVKKDWLFKKGGRPVIYQPDNEYKCLSNELKYRHKGYNPLANIDFTWEREWRICIDELSLESAITTLVVPSRNWVEFFKDNYLKINKLKILALGGDSVFYQESDPWHYIALEDLGIKVDWGKEIDLSKLL